EWEEFGNGGIGILPSSDSLTIMESNSRTLSRRFLKLLEFSSSSSLSRVLPSSCPSTPLPLL
ncbi:hypothetical protein A2U01_0114086, partial [Trifolium medium]|nr:hypothetical protein [Trifolium medium]